MRKTVTAIAAGASAAALLGMGIATADPIPTNNYEMCGYVYQGAFVDNYPAPPGPGFTTGLPSGVTPLAGYTVTGTLTGGGGSAVTYTALPTGPGGEFCLKGTAVMVPRITLGGVVKLSVAAPAGGLTTTPVISHAPGGIDTSAFAAHQYGGLTSTKATGFNIAYP